MPIEQELSDLVERFDRNIDAYKSGGYNEAQVRKEFIDPFFELLGWDVAGPVAIDDDAPIGTSFPGFAVLMTRLGARIEAAEDR